MIYSFFAHLVITARISRSNPSIIARINPTIQSSDNQVMSATQNENQNPKKQSKSKFHLNNLKSIQFDKTTPDTEPVPPIDKSKIVFYPFPSDLETGQHTGANVYCGIPAHEEAAFYAIETVHILRRRELERRLTSQSNSANAKPPSDEEDSDEYFTFDGRNSPSSKMK